MLRRLTAKTLMLMVREEAHQALFPAQVGVGVPSGAEAAVHSVRAWLRRHAAATGKVAFKLDFRNAFNSVSRQAVLDSATTSFPGLARWSAWCYAAPSMLRFGAG